MYPQVLQKALARHCSDHNPIAIFCEGMKHGPSPFRCFIFYKKLQLLKQRLKDWSKMEFGDVDRRLEELENIFVDLDAEDDVNNGLTEEQWNERLQARQDYCKLTISRAEKWRAMSRVNHIKDFENNTKYFHRFANDRRRRSYIGSIKVNGSLTSDENEIKSGIVSYFQNIFQSQHSRTFSMEGMDFSKISEERCAWLEREVDEEECMSAMKLLGQNNPLVQMGFQ
ncbi:uncharacterized protein LOC113295905 [Papaver somniferum]|uniref:uncharacterized protein LOC113295905 n=1 Tax=Papaver somniferum TaxID=3469 RepID=UPI000E6FD6E7|nr:uncharacterized protein LOC113295905 [Papaver somniferum]